MEKSSSEGSLSSSVADDIDGKSNHALLEELSNDYSRFLNFNVDKEQSKFSESVEAMLTKLEEFCGLVDMIRSDTSLCLSKTMPEIQAKCQDMEQMFDRIDRLEAFVGVVKKDVIAMEDCVTKAESELNSGNLIRRLSSLVSSKKSSSSSTQKPQFTPPPIFRTDRYLNGPSSESAAQASTTDTVPSTSVSAAAVSASSAATADVSASSTAPAASASADVSASSTAPAASAVADAPVTSETTDSS